jgi:hypothetical protein
MIFCDEGFWSIKFKFESFISIMPNYDGIDIFTSSSHGEKMYVNRVVFNQNGV